MSEPLSSTEIEDVLSSIRRLVSEELRPATQIAPAAESDAAVAEADKLLLTPALRVVPTARRVEAPVAAPEITPDVAPDIASDIAPPDLSEAAQDWTPQPFVLQVPAAEAPEASALAAPEAPVSDAPEPAPAEARARLSTLLVWQDEGETYDEDEVWAAPGIPEDEDEPAPLPPHMAAISAAATGATLHLVSGGQATTMAGPPVAEDLPPTFTPHPRRRPKLEDEPLARVWADRAEAEVHAALAQSSEAPAEAVAEGLDAPDVMDSPPEPLEMTLDDAMLRDLVRQIIREELAGDLGERITRNVRKLVRAEISRSLAARDLS